MGSERAAPLELAARKRGATVEHPPRRDASTGASAGVNAAAFTAYVLAVALLGLVVLEWVQGRNGSPFRELCTLYGAAYIGAWLWYRRRA
jgi:hypothetical protein